MLQTTQLPYSNVAHIFLLVNFELFSPAHISRSPPSTQHTTEKGQMMYIEESDLIMFQCYPSVMNLDDLTA